MPKYIPDYYDVAFDVVVGNDFIVGYDTYNVIPLIMWTHYCYVAIDDLVVTILSILFNRYYFFNVKKMIQQKSYS